MNTSTPISSKQPPLSHTVRNLDYGKGKKPYIEKICEAIKVVGMGKKGASYEKIKKYLASEDAQINMNFVKKALIKGLETGVLKRSTKSANAVGAVGYFLVNEKHKSAIKAPKKVKEAKEVKEAEVPKATKKKDAKTNVKTESEEVESTPENIEPKKPKKTLPKKEKVAKDKNSDTKENDGHVSKPLPAAKNKVLSTKNAASKPGRPAKKKPEQRLDVSDSEVVVKKKIRKSLKSYSSDTELNLTTVVKTEKKVKGKVPKQLKQTISKPSTSKKPSKKDT